MGAVQGIALLGLMRTLIIGRVTFSIIQTINDMILEKKKNSLNCSVGITIAQLPATDEPRVET